MASIVEEVSDAVVSLIESGEAQGEFAISIVTERAYDTSLELEDTETVSVLVVPVSSNRTRLSQNTWNRDIALDVVVRKRFAASSFNSAGLIDKEDIDPYVELLEQIDEWLANRDNAILPGLDASRYIDDDSREADPEIVRQLGIRYLYYPDHLVQLHQYTGVLRVAYHVYQESV